MQGEHVMKKSLITCLCLISSFCYSQSYFILDNGLTLTTDTQGYVYDYGHYTPITRITQKGGQFILEDQDILVTVDERGFPFRKYEVLPKSILGKGNNYFIGDDSSIYTIDSKGNVNFIENDPKIAGAGKFGGIFFVVENELFVVSANGKYQSVKVEGLKPSDIITLGGNYFMTNRGVLYTISFDGKVFSRYQERVGIIAKKGGNYFVDSMGMFYTVHEDGSLRLPAIPMSLRIQTMTKLGANYFIDSTGKLFTVDKKGDVFERMINHDLKMTKVISI